VRHPLTAELTKRGGTVDETFSKSRAEDLKKPYAKPQIQEVPLRPDEAVLGGCKTSSVSGPAQHRCNSPTSCSSTVS
jgi:hypothetical protein